MAAETAVPLWQARQEIAAGARNGKAIGHETARRSCQKMASPLDRRLGGRVSTCKYHCPAWPSRRGPGPASRGGLRRACLALLALASCTHVQLTASTVSTATTVMEIEYQMVMDNLAHMVRNPATLPSEIRIKQGTVQVSDELGIYQLQASGSTGGTFGGPRAERTVSEQWGADAISDPRAVKELQDVYRAAMQLPPMTTPDFLTLDQARKAAQGSTKKGPGSGHDDAPAIDLQRDVPHGWFHTGTKGQVPGDAAYVGHSGDRWVWVIPDELDGLSRFTMVVLFVTKLGPGEHDDTGAGLMYTAGGR